MTTEAPVARSRTNLEDMPKSGTLLLFSDQQNGNFQKNKIEITVSSFIRLGLKNAKFNNCVLTQCSFVDSYFRKASFVSVDFTGSTFRNCNFDKASFQLCDFRYCNFYFCKLPSDEIKSCLPSEPNLRRELARSIRNNYEMMGDKKSANIFTDIEIKAYEKELKEIFLSKTKYYKDHYDVLNRVSSGLKFLLSVISGRLWGYGHRISRLISSYLFMIIMLSLITYLGQFEFYVQNHTFPKNLTMMESFQIIFCETVNASSLSFSPTTIWGQLVLWVASLLGIIFLALLAATLYKKISR